METSVKNTSYFDGPSNNTVTEIIVAPFRVIQNLSIVFFGQDYYIGTPPYIRLATQDIPRMPDGQTYSAPYYVYDANLTILFIKDQLKTAIDQLTIACLYNAGKTCKSIQLPVFRPDSHSDDCDEQEHVQLMLNGIRQFQSENSDTPMQIFIRLSELSVARVTLDDNHIPYLGIWDTKTRTLIKK